MGTKTLLLSLLGVGALGGATVRTYYAFNSSTKKEQETEDKSQNTQLNTKTAQTSTPREEGAVSSGTATTTRTGASLGSDTSNTGSSGSRGATGPSSQPGRDGEGVQLPSR